MRSHLPRLLLPLGALVALAGYFGPWVNHAAAGLVITGLDLAEVVKFLVPVREGAITLRREGFYLPPAAVSLSLSLIAFRPALGYSWGVRALLLAMATMAALNLLPPAWTPALLTTSEFRLQVAAMVLLPAAAACSPLLALLPGWLIRLGIVLMSLAAIVLPVAQFYRILPALSELYAHPLDAGWGVWVTAAGLSLLALAAALLRE